MGIDAAALILAAVAAALAVMATAAWTRARRRVDALEDALETARDALWEARDREDSSPPSGDASSAARAKSRFLAAVTHEMRTPLTGVVGAGDLLLDTALAPDQRTYALAMKTSAEAMLSLVDEILDLSRIEADAVALKAAPFDPAEVLEAVAELLAPRAHDKGLDLAIRIAADAPARMMGDAARLRQILLNLAGNAVKFTETGGVGLTLARDGDGARFEVADTGPGFDPEDGARIFAEFERAGADPALPGVGLGLAISKRLAGAMGGALTACSTPGAGATFTLRLPAADAAAQPVSAEALAGRRVAVVSAAPFSGPFLVEALAARGANATLVTQSAPHEVAAAVRDLRADAALIDRGATGRANDFAIAAKLGGATLCVALLAASERRELPALAADGFDGFLIKPVRPGSLVSRLADPRPISALAGAPAADAAGAAQPRAGGLRALLAEDDPVSALIAFAHLNRLGCSVQQAGDGVAACEAFDAEPFDVVLLDLRMPRRDGLTAARAMREAENASGRPPALILAVSANVAEDDRDAAREAGIDEMLAKPLDPARLGALLEARREDRARVA
ncbi:ATP-binding protein [Methylopila henanensis]|uniref:histidine kinase n=1 Tax=Methylopila henanensis TaxID=873516 RepID=A0ABW4K702_9HYPH